MFAMSVYKYSEINIKTTYLLTNVNDVENEVKCLLEGQCEFDKYKNSVTHFHVKIEIFS